MDLRLNGHTFTASVHERPAGNAVIRFRIDKARKQYAVSAGVKKEKAVTKDMVYKAIETWWAKNARRVMRPQEEPPPSPLDLVMEIRRYILEEYADKSPEHRDQVQTILLEMAALVPGLTVPQVTRQIFRATIKPAMAAGIKSKTWANKRSYLKGFFDWEMDQEDEAGRPHLEKHPMQGDRPPDPKTFGTHEEIWPERVFQAVHKWLPKNVLRGQEIADFLEDAWFTGMDNKDLIFFDPGKHMLEVSVEDGRGGVKKAWKVWKVRSKESEIIDQPLNATLPAKVMERWLKRRAEGGMLHPVTLGYTDHSSFSTRVLNVVYAAQKALGLPKLDVKSIRHTFETRWVRVYTESRGRRGPNPEEMRKWMGRAPGSTVGQRLYDKNKAWVDPDTV